MGVGILLKSLLRDRKMTIKQLSEQTGISINTLYSITKRDSESIDPVILLRITTALGISVDDFYSSVKTVRPVELFSKSSDVPNVECQEIDTAQEMRSNIADNFPQLDAQSIESLVKFFSQIPESRWGEVVECVRDVVDAFKYNPDLSSFEAKTQDGYFTAKLTLEKQATAQE